jgi:hypothetical protein
LVSVVRPFRWNVAKREQLGRLTAGETATTYPGFWQEFRECAARVVANAGDANLCFVGRSPESLFDYLSGALASSDWADRLSLVNLSLREQSLAEIANDSAAWEAFRTHLSAQQLSPAAIAAGTRPTALVDLVASGQTFERLVGLLLDWAEHSGVDRAAVRRRLRIVGIVRRTKTSPNTLRWQQHAPWLNQFPRIAVKNVSVSASLWDYLGNTQPKVADSWPPWRWTDPSAALPPRDPRNLSALALALRIFDFGGTAREQERLAGDLVRQAAMRERWCRNLVGQLRGTAVPTTARRR